MTGRRPPPAAVAWLSRRPEQARRAAVAVVAAVVVLAAAVAGVSQLTQPDPFVVQGTFTVTDSVGVLTDIMDAQGWGARSSLAALQGLHAGETFDCPRLAGGYRDIGVFTQVRVTDADGRLLGMGSLEGGTLDWDGCHFTFSVRVDDRAELYQFEVADRGVVAFRHEQLETNGYRVDLTL